MTPDELLALVDAMKSRGVRSFSANGVTVEFGAPEATLKTDAKHIEPDACDCGHGLHVHINGLCALGCAVEKCIPREAAA